MLIFGFLIMSINDTCVGTCGGGGSRGWHRSYGDCNEARKGSSGNVCRHWRTWSADSGNQGNAHHHYMCVCNNLIGTKIWKLYWINTLIVLMELKLYWSVSLFCRNQWNFLSLILSIMRKWESNPPKVSFYMGPQEQVTRIIINTAWALCILFF